VFGSYATQILGDQGAEVIKIEDPGSGRGDGGDIMRWAGHVPEGAPRDLGPIFLTINRNKRSVVVDMRDPATKPLMAALIASCEVFATSIRYDGLKRLGLSYEDVRALRPDVVYVHAAGYGSEGPYAGEPAYDDLIQSASGLADLLPRTDGNPTPRIVETPGGMLNAIGLQNPGTDNVVRAILPALDFDETRFIANVSGSTIEEYAEVTRRFDDSPIDAIEINISCPNVKEGGVAFGNYPEMSARVVAACRAVTKKPLITKLSPNQTDIKENARLCIEAGSDGLAVINTVMGMAIDVKSRKPVIGNVQGGLSGPAIKPIALLKVHQVYDVAKKHGVPIIGQGGIVNATDALEFIIAGASAVGVGTSLFYDPMSCKKINAGIADYLRHNGYGNVTELVGTLTIPPR
jgi:dihydroorotate dehydrogenase (NAD+) catalytic subunit